MSRDLVFCCPTQSFSQIVKMIDVNSYEFVGLSERFFEPGRFCGAYYDMLVSEFKAHKELVDELGAVPTNVSQQGYSQVVMCE